MNDDTVIRPARVEERGDLESLMRRSSLAGGEHREALLAHPDAIEVPPEQIERGQVLVATAAGVIRGFGAVVPRENGEAELDALFVDPDHWRQGLGRLLVERLVAQARAMGTAELHVVANPQAEGFYASTGFELLGTTPTRFGVALSMRRRL